MSLRLTKFPLSEIYCFCNLLSAYSTESNFRAHLRTQHASIYDFMNTANLFSYVQEMREVDKLIDTNACDRYKIDVA
jgi:hypothetical protein